MLAVNLAMQNKGTVEPTILLKYGGLTRRVIDVINGLGTE